MSENRLPPKPQALEEAKKTAPVFDVNRREPYSEAELKQLLYQDFLVREAAVKEHENGMTIQNREQFEVLWKAILEIFANLKKIFPKTRMGLEEFITSLDSARKNIRIKGAQMPIVTVKDESVDLPKEVVMGAVLLGMKGVGFEQLAAGRVYYRPDPTTEYVIFRNGSVGVQDAYVGWREEELTMLIGKDPFKEIEEEEIRLGLRTGPKKLPEYNNEEE